MLQIAIVEFYCIVLLIILSGWSLMLSAKKGKTIREQSQALLLIKANYEQMLLTTQLEIQAQTCKNITHEIHDHIGQNLSLAKLRLSQLATENTFCNTQEPKALIASSIKELRNIANSLDPDCTQVNNIEKSIRHELTFIEKDGLLVTTLEVSGRFKSMNIDKNIVLFRIFQEVANNTIQHAQANNLRVSLFYGTDSVICTVEDDGKGFIVGSDEGHSFTRLQKRAALISANIDITSLPGKGTAVTIEVPY